MPPQQPIAPADGVPSSALSQAPTIYPKKAPSAPIAAIVTSKNWTLPPRPKPGRKPGDKRKAGPPSGSQAAKKRPNEQVRELEQQLLEAQNEITKLNKIIAGLKSELSLYKNVHEIEQSLINEDSSPGQIPQNTPPADLESKGDHEDHDGMCGICDAGDGCLCDDIGIRRRTIQAPPKEAKLELDINLADIGEIKSVPLRRNPTQKPLKHRFKKLPQARERDMTPIYSSHSLRSSQESTPSTIQSPSNEFMADDAQIDPCGFCSKDTPCLCRDTLKEESKKSASEPGSCAQCQEDPMSTLFCASLASASKHKLTSSATVSCKEAYQVISRHKQFTAADLSDIVNNLESDGTRVDVNSLSHALKKLDH
ncbi:hypothetical protein TRVA0_026S01354 [Trichomonascus vanleenenianus]|uniref:uncharacterized protein n=1 Tax=Trichomonascus vanleenenianus TaxID=2268995 RepID=UPI003ECB4B9E